MKQFRLPYYSIILDDYQRSREHAHDLTALILSQHYNTCIRDGPEYTSEPNLEHPMQCNAMKTPDNSIVPLMPIVFEYIDQFNLTTAEEFVSHFRAVNATGALATQYHSSISSRDRTAIVDTIKRRNRYKTKLVRINTSPFQ
jgi:hypothetical protein